MAKPTSSPKTGAKFPEAASTMPKVQEGSSSAVARHVVPDMLTPAELERLRRKQSEAIDYGRNVFGKK